MSRQHPKLSSSQYRWLNFLRIAHNFLFNSILLLPKLKLFFSSAFQ